MPVTNIITAIVTAYCSCKICCGPNAKGICANNKPPVEGKTIAAPRSIHLGSTIQIDGKSYTASDRTAIRYDGRFDIYFRSHQKAKAFGKQIKQVTIITK
jgi:3D (Asp-Asp-Asp) domain-containing protein